MEYVALLTEWLSLSIKDRTRSLELLKSEKEHEQIIGKITMLRVVHDGKFDKFTDTLQRLRNVSDVELEMFIPNHSFSKKFIVEFVKQLGFTGVETISVFCRAPHSLQTIGRGVSFCKQININANEIE
jgi:hypothetical protein